MSKEFESKVLESLAELKGTTTSMQSDMTIMKSDIRLNTIDLTEHKQMSQTNKSRFELEKEIQHEKDKLFDERLVKVEFVPNFINSAKRVIIWVGSIAIAIYAIDRTFFQ